ncbi:hypothetical protein HBI16_010300 [Parastagonospora nodorum]|nr:hypothetical protein HBH52_079220 [Parastagonospora nodorum]KAH5787896.1 hypothetical protein HBI16_010300 [Parastagonospora nodorum]KAH6013421.1 hypothetical protein HBI84_016790 [Parastagonospora nodorum]
MSRHSPGSIRFAALLYTSFKFSPLLHLPRKINIIFALPRVALQRNCRGSTSYSASLPQLRAKDLLPSIDCAVPPQILL